MARTIRETAIGPCPVMVVVLSSCCVRVCARGSEVECRVMCPRYRDCVAGVVGEIKQRTLILMLVGVV